MWQIKQLNNLTPVEFYRILKLRIDVFVVAQNRVYHELDEHDPEAYHVFFEDDDTQEVLAYARVFKKGHEVTFGRVVTAPAARGRGLGGQLVEQILALANQQWPGQSIEIESQEQVVGLYEKYGFQTVGEPFIFEGTPHVKMVLDK